MSSLRARCGCEPTLRTQSIGGLIQTTQKPMSVDLADLDFLSAAYRPKLYLWDPNLLEAPHTFSGLRVSSGVRFELKSGCRASNSTRVSMGFTSQRRSSGNGAENDYWLAKPSDFSSELSSYH